MKVLVIRTDGTMERHEIAKREALAIIERLIGADRGTDSVNLRDGRVMIVDDHGYETKEVNHGDRIELKPIRALKPVNAEATKIYHAVCKPGTTHQIVGDVVIATDEDFA